MLLELSVIVVQGPDYLWSQNVSPPGPWTRTYLCSGLSPYPPTCCMVYVLALNLCSYCMSYLVIVLSCVASYHSYLQYVEYGKWVNLAIVAALHLVLWTSLLYRQLHIVSLSYDKCTYCEGLWIKVSARCPKCKCLNTQASKQVNWPIFLHIWQQWKTQWKHEESYH